MANIGIRRASADGLPLLQLIPASTNVENASQPLILNLTITNVTGLWGWQATIYFENAVLNFVDASEGPFLISTGNDTFWPSPTVTNGFNATHGRAFLGCLFVGNVTGVDGSGVLATMTFQPVGGGNATVHISTDTEDTILLDRYLNRIPYTTADAAVSIPVFRNIAVTNVLPWKTVIGQGYTGNVSVAIADPGTTDETFNVTAYLNSTSFATQTVTLASGTSQTIILKCNTSAITKGRITVSATVPTLLNEINTTDNTFVDGWINVTIPGDINGNFWVQLNDLVLLATSYGSHPGDLRWNPNADIDDNGVVGLSDLVILALHYGQKV